MRPEARRDLEVFGGRASLHALGRGPDGRSPEASLVWAAAQLRTIHARLTRFDDRSELSLLNADPRPEVAVSPLLARLCEAVAWAGELSGGLVDATRLADLEAAGYSASRRGQVRLDPTVVLEHDRLPARPAAPHPDAGHARVHVDRARSVVCRPPGLRIDSGGLAKGLAADLVSATLKAHRAWAVDCGGDLRVGGLERRIEVAHPLSGDRVHALVLGDGAVATSGVTATTWRGPDGRVAHHLIDPATGQPAWTGLLQVTAVAPTALEAEVRAKAALLAGPAAAVAMLGAAGGVLVDGDGGVQVVGEPARPIAVAA